ncbi:hypothetical protein QBC44DRAFT_338149 [Cladorrhinum sp. PSN332]|nr:hypothetical protein QBC44DRAFT_338149 [Cladorrhinum sp. PSN332]
MRDEHLHSRPSGWGLSIRAEALVDCLPSGLFKQLSSIQVDPRQVPTADRVMIDHGTGFLNLEVGEPFAIIPSSFRRRIDRGRLRELLPTGIDVNWGKTVSRFQQTASSVSVTFTDGDRVEGCMLVAADGGRSKVRQLLFGSIFRRPLFQGNHPDTGFYMFFSILSTPSVNGSDKSETPFMYYEVELNLSWLAEGPDDVVPTTNRDRLARMKYMATAGTGLHPAMRDIILGIPDDAEVYDVVLEDWPTMEWPDLDGRVTLLGDVAHHMVMYLGEGANQGIIDATNLAQQLTLHYDGHKTLRQAVIDYEKEMILRAREAVLLSRQACLDAHDLRNLTKNSPDKQKCQSRRQPWAQGTNRRRAD